MAKKSDYIREIDPNRKSSRSFNLEKNERRCFNIEKEEGNEPVEKGAANRQADSSGPRGGKDASSKKWVWIGLIALVAGMGAAGLWSKCSENKSRGGGTSIDSTEIVQSPASQAGSKPSGEELKAGGEASSSGYGHDVPVQADTASTVPATSPQAISCGERSVGNTAGEAEADPSFPDSGASKETEIKLSSFAFGEVDGSTTPELKELVEKLKSDLTLKVTIAGYTDKMGDSAYNQWLSEQRARFVKAVLVRNGIDVNRVKAVGKGVSTRYATNADNRRVVWILE